MGWEGRGVVKAVTILRRFWPLGWKWPSGPLGRCPDRLARAPRVGALFFGDKAGLGLMLSWEFSSTSYKFLGCKAKMRGFSRLIFSPQERAQTSEGHPVRTCRKNLPRFPS